MFDCRPYSWSVFLVCLFLTGLWPWRANGQNYFGQNKVRYETFDFKVLSTQDFDIYYYDRERQATEDAARMAERWRARHARILSWELSSGQPVILYDSHPAFEGTTVIPGFIGAATGGVTEALKRRVVMPFAGPLGETDHVLGHELVHAFQYDMASRPGPMGGAGAPGILSLPLWFIEGMAEYLSVGPDDPLTAMWMRDSVRREDFPSIADLNNPKYFPYRYGQAFWAFVGGRYGDDTIGKILQAAGRIGSLEGAFSRVLGVSSDELSAQWRQALIDQYEPVLKLTEPPRAQAKLLIAGKEDDGLSVGPVVSPDGTQMILFSQRDPFSIDLYLADATTGHFKRRITKSALNPHIGSLEFINSAGAWAPDGRRFVYPAIHDGRPQLAIYDVQNDETIQRISLSAFGQVFSPSWSPDGQSIAFSALRNGLSDLFMVDLKTGQVRPLTDDQFAELQPAWSPDGKQIAFVTDRFTSDVSDLSFGEYRIGLLDAGSGQIRELPAFDTGKHINPQWSPDGASLYFISDRDGVSNIYRISLPDGRLYQLTNLQTGVTGITALSPALSVAAKSNRMIFSVFLDGAYSIFGEDATAAPGESPRTALAGLAAGVLPGQRRPSGEVASLIEQPQVGLTSGAQFASRPYDPHLALDYIAPPSVGVGYTSFGTMIGGGTALYFSDMLNYYTLTTAFQTATTTEQSNLLNSLSGVVSFQDQRHRWTWGLTGGQIPFLTARYGQSVATVDGEPAVIDQSVLFWQINREATATLAYPFNRAQRIEFSGGFQNISFDTQARAQAYSAVTGEFLGQQQANLPSPDSLNQGTGGAALVYDTSIFGGTSPITGQRYRFEIVGSGGTLTYATALADYRRYFHLARPATLAFRLLHYGRYGSGSDDNRLQELFLGYPSLVRGYDPNSFSVAECGSNANETGTCPVFDRLLGSRIAVGNAELRIPLLGYFGIIPSRGLPPIEIAPFYDAGIAWNRAQPVPRRAITSYGASLRVNVFGFAIAQISFVHPDDRPAKRWLWEFSLIPGF